MVFCLFCNQEEPGYKSSENTNFICSSCVQALLGAEQPHLRRAYEKAVSKGYEGKALAIESFLIPENEDGQRKQGKPKRRSKRISGKAVNRKRIARNFRR